MRDLFKDEVRQIGEALGLPHRIISRRIINEVRHVSRAVYDISGKPLATIEWE